MQRMIRGMLTLLLACLSLAPATGSAEPPRDLPVKNTVTMIDLGAKTCVPCKMMEPILKELTEEYRGRAAIVFVDVWEERALGRQFGVQAIPTQIFFDRHGREVYRHVGFFSRQDIKKWVDMLLERS